MNLPRLLRCQDCNERFLFPEPFHSYWYGPGPVAKPVDHRWAPMLLHPIWCSACNQPSLAERIPSIREFEIAAAVRKTQNHAQLAELDDDLLQLTQEEFAVLVMALRDRRDSGRCVLCGGRSYLILVREREHIRNLRHQYCGGELEYSGWLPPYFGRETGCYYDFDGRPLQVADTQAWGVTAEGDLDPQNTRAAYAHLHTNAWSAHQDEAWVLPHIVDAYTAQTADVGTSRAELGFALAGLYLRVEKGYSGGQVQFFHARLARAQRESPVFAVPSERGRITSVQVWATPRGAERDAAIDAWCAEVWDAYRDSQAAVSAWVREYGIE